MTTQPAGSAAIIVDRPREENQPWLVYGIYAEAGLAHSTEGFVFGLRTFQSEQSEEVERYAETLARWRAVDRLVVR